MIKHYRRINLILELIINHFKPIRLKLHLLDICLLQYGELQMLSSFLLVRNLLFIINLHKIVIFVMLVSIQNIDKLDQILNLEINFYNVKNVLFNVKDA